MLLLLNIDGLPLIDLYIIIHDVLRLRALTAELVMKLTCDSTVTAVRPKVLPLRGCFHFLGLQMTGPNEIRFSRVRREKTLRNNFNMRKS